MHRLYRAIKYITTKGRGTADRWWKGLTGALYRFLSATRPSVARISPARRLFISYQLTKPSLRRALIVLCNKYFAPKGRGTADRWWKGLTGCKRRAGRRLQRNFRFVRYYARYTHLRARKFRFDMEDDFYISFTSEPQFFP